MVGPRSYWSNKNLQLQPRGSYLFNQEELGGQYQELGSQYQEEEVNNE